MFDARMETPGQISICPNPEERFVQDRKKKATPVSAVDLCMASGQLGVGHEGGELKYFKWSDNERTRPALAIHRDIQAVPLDATVYQNPGWQFHFQSTAHRATILACKVSSALGLLVACDTAGTVSLTDCSDEPEVLFVAKIASSPIRSVQFAFLGDILLAPRSLERTWAQSDFEQDVFALRDCSCIVCYMEDSSVVILNLRGERMIQGGEGQVLPKGPGRGVTMQTLNESGAPTRGLYRWKAFRFRPLTNKPEKTEVARRESRETTAEPETDAEAKGRGAADTKGRKRRGKAVEEEEDDVLAMAAAQMESKLKKKHEAAPKARGGREEAPKTGRRTGRTLANAPSTNERGGGEGEDGPLGTLEEARYLLTVTRNNLRVYQTRSVLDGKRQRLRKGKLPGDERGEIVYASAFEAESGSGVVCLLDTGAVYTYSCPGMLLLHKVRAREWG